MATRLTDLFLFKLLIAYLRADELMEHFKFSCENIIMHEWWSLQNEFDWQTIDNLGLAFDRDCPVQW